MNSNDIIEYINENLKLKKIFYSHFIKKYEFDGYLNSASYHKKQWKPLQYYNDTVKELYKLTDSSNNNFIINKTISIVIVNSKAETKEKCDMAVTMFIKEYIDYYLSEPSRLDGYYIHKSTIKINKISSLCNYIEFLTKINTSKNTEIFFRGQSDINYVLLPSILRSKKWYSKEKYLYNSITRMCPKDFNGFQYHIDRLVEMQHYELPTRLLDISKNALVALLFVCLGDMQKDGEIIVFAEETEKIKYGQSDIVTIISCLPSFSEDEQKQILDSANEFISNIEEFNKTIIVQRLLHEIKTEKPAFKDIINPKDITKIILALPALLNNRIIKQSGAFIITGLVDFDNAKEVSQKLNSIRYKEKEQIPIYVVEAKYKNMIKNQLEICDLNEGTVFPEIDRLSRYLKNNLDNNGGF